MSNIRYHSNFALTCRCIATRWGVSIAKEDDAVLNCKDLNENHIGLLHHPEHDWIGASPVGVYNGCGNIHGVACNKTQAMTSIICAFGVGHSSKYSNQQTILMRVKKALKPTVTKVTGCDDSSPAHRTGLFYAQLSPGIQTGSTPCTVDSVP